MSKYRKLTHVYYKCDYYIVFTPKYHFRILDGMLKSLIEHDLQVISTWKDVQIQELNVQVDHIHMVCSVPAKVSISEFITGKSQSERGRTSFASGFIQNKPMLGVEREWEVGQ